MGLSIPAIARIGATLYATREACGVLGFDAFASGLVGMVVKAELRAHRRDSDALAEMVDLAKSRVPVDTGRLLNGITGEIENDLCVFSASAVHDDRPGSGEDYAHFVEFGTHAGVAGQFHEIVAEPSFFSGASGPPAIRRRRSLRTHGGTQAQPFFFNSAREVLARRSVDLADVMTQAGREEGFA